MSTRESEGNANKGSMDLISTIEGATHDFKLLLDFLPCYLAQFKTFHNVMMGVSLGGHTAWRMPAVAPGKLDALAIVVGCPDLSSLLLDRLGVNMSLTATTTYQELEVGMTEQQKARWPRPLFDVVREADAKISNGLPELPMLLCNGKYDTLVPAGYTESWVERQKQRAATRLYVQDNTGHSCTLEMVAMIADWLGELYGNRV